MVFPPGGPGDGSPELGKYAVCLVRGCRGPDREACTLPLVLKMCARRSSAEAPQDQVVVCVVPYVPDRYVLEHTAVCAQDLVGPGAHLLAALVHGPFAAIL